jgi:hypothetical protein
MSEFSPGMLAEDPKFSSWIAYAEERLTAAAVDEQTPQMFKHIAVSDLFVSGNWPKVNGKKTVEPGPRPQLAMNCNRIVREFVFPLFNWSELLEKPVKDVDKHR